MAVCSDGSYGIDSGLIFSFPVRTSPGGNYTIVPVGAFFSMSAIYFPERVKFRMLKLMSTVNKSLRKQCRS